MPLCKKLSGRSRSYAGRGFSENPGRIAETNWNMQKIKLDI